MRLQERVRCLVGVLAFVFLLAAGLAMAAPVKENIQEKMGDLEFQYNPQDGVRLNYHGVPIVKGSTFFVIWPRWAGVFYEPGYNKTILKTAEIKRSPDKVEITLHHEGTTKPDCPVFGTELFTLSKNNTYTANIRFTFSNPSQTANFDWVGAQIYATPFGGKSYQVMTGTKTKTGIFPLSSGDGPASSQSETILAKNFNQIKWESALGPIEFIMDQPAKEFTWLDYRKVDWALPGAAPQFWMGIMGDNIINGKEHHYGFTIKFPEKSDKIAKSVPGGVIPVTLASIPDAVKPNQDPQSILPQPKEMKFTGQQFNLSSPVQVYVGTNYSPEIITALEFLADELKNKYNLTINGFNENPGDLTQIKNAIILGEDEHYPQVARQLAREGVNLPKNEEAYALSITNDRVLLAAHSVKGIFYGITSLVQLVKVDEKGISFKGAQIKDYPSLDYRGIHLYTGKDRGDEQSKAVRELMARYKINNMVWNCEAIKWARHPELDNKAMGMDKSDALKVVNTARKYFIELTPCIPALGHADWMFWNGQNRDILEDTTRAESYCPDNPKSYQLLFDVYDEALQMFKPKYFHISECEINIPGTPVCKEIIKHTGKSKMDIILDDEKKIADWFRERKVTPMLWGDMFLKPGEGPDATNSPDSTKALQNRKDLPKNYIVTAWHYAPASPEAYKSLNLFQKTGNKVIGASWYLPINIQNFTQACIKRHALGLLQTTWAGFSMKITDDPDNWMQYQAYLWAAHYSWSGDNTPATDLPFDATQKFIDVWFDKKPVLKPQPGFTVDLSQACNQTLADNKLGTGWAGFGPKLDLSQFPNGNLTLGETYFSVKPNEKQQAAVMLAGRLNPTGTYPDAVIFEIKDKSASKLHFLLTAGNRENDKTEIGQIKVTFSDGSTDTMKLVYHQNIWAFNDLRVAYTKDSLENGRIAWKSKTPSGEYAGVRDIVWTNPTPAKSIRSITVSSVNTVASPILLAITAVN